MRLEGQAKAGEYPAPVSAVLAVASMLRATSPERTTVADPFGSDGRTLITLAEAELAHREARDAALRALLASHADACDIEVTAAGLEAAFLELTADQEAVSA